MKFAHLADCHLGGWQQPELKELNFRSFQYAVNTCIKEKVDFILIAGDLFDSAYPPIDTLKNTFDEFRKLKEAKIPVFLIAGSHDYSVSGKSFLDVLEKAGFCKISSLYEEKGDKIILYPLIHHNVAIYGYPGRKSSLEVNEIEKIKLQDSPGLFKILMLHTAIRSAVSNTAIEAVNDSLLPKVDYLALGHLHIRYAKANKVYSGPIFPNNLSELEELQGGSFYIFENGNLRLKEIKIKEVYTLNLEIKNTLNITENIISYLSKENLKDKIVIIKLFGVIEQGKLSDIDFAKINSFLKEKKALTFLRSTTRLYFPSIELKFSDLQSENFEETIIKKFEEDNPSKFNEFIHPLVKALQMEKLDDEKSSNFQDRLLSETKKVLRI